MNEVLTPTIAEANTAIDVTFSEPTYHARKTAVLPIEELEARARNEELEVVWRLVKDGYTAEQLKTVKFRSITKQEIDKLSNNDVVNWFEEISQSGLAAQTTKEKLANEILRLRADDKFVPQEVRNAQIDILNEKIANYDRIMIEIYTARIVEVSSKTLGTVSSQMSEVKAHGDEIGTIYLLPGIAGGLTEMENVVAELTWQGYRVITIGYPESVGTLSEEYAAGGNGKPLGPQVEFMSAVLEKSTTPVEVGGKPQILMGFSTGGITAAGILGNKDMAHRFSHAVIMSPGGAQDRSLTTFVKGVVSEIGQFIKNHTVEFQPGVARRNPDGSVVPVDAKQLILKAKTLLRLIPQTMHRQIEMWKAARSDIVDIVVCASPDDLVTGAHSVLREITSITQDAGKGSIKTAELTGSHIAINADPLAMLLAPFRRIGLQLRHPPPGQEQIAPNPFV
jgi:dienelactone hydrolase